MTPTAKEFLKSKIILSRITLDDYPQLMIEFAKLHVEAALKQASEKVYNDIEIDWVNPYDYSAGHNGLKGDVHKDSILTAYSLENIK